MTTPKMPSLVKTAVNRRAHQLALVQAATIKENLTREVLRELAAGVPAAQVLAVLAAKGATT